MVKKKTDEIEEIGALDEVIQETPEPIVKFGKFNADGLPEAFYSSEIHSAEIIAGATEITDEQWQEFINNPGSRKWADGKVIEYTAPAYVPSWDDIKVKQAQLLSETDYRVLPDSPLTGEELAKWVKYRADVRNVRNTFESPEKVKWPIKPE